MDRDHRRCCRHGERTGPRFCPRPSPTRGCPHRGRAPGANRCPQAYEELRYKLSLEFPSGYPYTAPTVRFLTPCYHPNVDTQGNICLDILKDKWSALYDVRTILLSIQSLLAGGSRGGAALGGGVLLGVQATPPLILVPRAKHREPPEHTRC